MTRPEWDETFTAIALIWSQRSTCSRRKVGAVLVKDKKVIGNGYNGVPSGFVHCVDGGCPRGQLSKFDVPSGSDYNAYPCHAIHAEHNAILQAGLAESRGSVLYTTEPPCQQCTNLIEHAGIEKVIVVGGGLVHLSTSRGGASEGVVDDMQVSPGEHERTGDGGEEESRGGHQLHARGGQESGRYSRQEEF